MRNIPVLDHLEQQLVTAIAADQEQARRAVPVGADRRSGPAGRVKRWLGTGAAAAAVAAAVTVVGLPGPAPDPVSPSLPLGVAPARAEATVQRDAGVVRVQIAHVAADPDAVRRALARAGVPVSIQFVPASPSLVGTLVATEETAGAAGAVQVEYTEGAQPGDDVAAVRVPADLAGHVGLTIGRRALTGERYVASAQSASEPGEPLHCVDLYGGRPVGDVLPEIRARDLVVHWRDERQQARTEDEVRDQYVNAATSLAPREVLIETTEEDPSATLSEAYRQRLRAGCPD